MNKVLTKTVFIISIIAICISIFGCRRPYDKPEFVSLGPNETAFVIPLDTESLDGQAQVRSIDFLNSKKVLSKRIQIPHRWVQTGRHGWNGEYLPTIRVVRVNRSPASREYTADAQTGSTTKNQALWVESSDSIEFSIATVLSGQVDEENTARFLYQFSGRSLEDVMDTDMRSALLSEMNNQFGKRTLVKCSENKVLIMDTVAKNITDKAAKWGITITTCGAAGGFVYRDQEIQQQINDQFKAEKAVVIAEQERLAQANINKKNIEKSIAEAESAKEWAKAKDIYKEKIRLENEKLISQGWASGKVQLPQNMMIIPEKMVSMMPMFSGQFTK